MNNFTEFVGNHLFLSVSFLGLLTYWILGELKQRMNGTSAVSPIDATRLMNHSNAVVIDVREDKEMSDGTIINAIHIPVGDISNQIKKIEKYKEKPVIVACRSGHRSASACNTLRKQGFLHVYNLRGGVNAWQKDGMPLVKK
ncbi:MAG: rhodanese-like domain-containing protein [Gammaproteobacteria bacterium]|nr:rhodanese-like domain-containing protein [Gammaproteobacteria bacterium]